MKKKNGRLSAPDRQQQILQVAQKLFACQGFNGTTTRQIAERSGVSEATIFRHFPTKEDLYWAIIDDKCQESGNRENIAKAMKSSEKDEEIFSSIAEGIFRRNFKDPTLSRLLLFSALENHRLSHRFFRTFMAINYEVLAGHIRKRIREGRFRQVDPVLAARGFLGMVVYHFWTQELFGGKRYQKFDLKRVSSVLSGIWLEGMRLPHTKS